jgi:hypothetical protein
MKMSQQSGMADGGVVGFAEGKEVEGAPTPTNLGSREAASARIAKERVARQQMEQDERQRAAELEADKLNELFSVTSQDNQPQQTFTLSADGSLTPNIPIEAPTTEQRPPAQRTNPFNVGVDLPPYRMQGVRKPSAAQPLEGIAGIFENMVAKANEPITTGSTSESTNKNQALVDAMTERNLDPSYVEDTRKGVETRARDAYGVPEELKALYQSRLEALDRPMFTPEE